MNEIEKTEKTYEYNGIKIKYVYRDSQKQRDKLIIAFSAFASRDSKPLYNYMRILSQFDIPQLFILDEYGGRGCYYLGQAPDFLVEQATSALIRYILKEKSIDRNNVMCIGSSKGGWAALYFAVKMKLGHAVVGEPQIFIGKYLEDVHDMDVPNYMRGGGADGEWLRYIECEAYRFDYPICTIAGDSNTCGSGWISL